MEHERDMKTRYTGICNWCDEQLHYFRTHIIQSICVVLSISCGKFKTTFIPL